MKSPSVLHLSLRYGGIFAAAVAIVGSTIGYLLEGVPGLVSALLGAVLAAVFMGLTAVSVIIASRLSPNGESIGLYFGVISIGWLVKVIVFVAVALILREQSWMIPYAFFWSALVAVIGSLIADAVAFARARVPYVGDIALPGDE
jgi:hypothetical protein